ncbi:MAG: DUF262 domain-containing protein [Candidatus Binataceae bacterium]
MRNAALFGDDGTIVGMELLKFLRWAEKSDNWLASSLRPTAPDYGVLALPPVQRTAVWGPKQIVDLWDSALRGLPLGTLFLVQQHVKRTVRGTGLDAASKVISEPGWDLLDGQQRTRALLLGLHGPCLEPDQQDKRCLWVDLNGGSQTHLFSLHLTSESQPFGYQPENGQKLPVTERRKARDLLTLSADRPVFDYELFAGFIENRLCCSYQPESNWRAGWPPLPAKAAMSPAVFPLHILLTAWLDGNSPENRLERLRHEINVGSVDAQITKLDEAFQCLYRAQIALIRVEVKNAELLLLFDRIGAGGTPLTEEERLYSVYKYHVPQIHNAVNAIYCDREVGRVLSPTKIAVCAIRIANARSSNSLSYGNWLPSISDFVKELGPTPNSTSEEPISARRKVSIREELATLLPEQIEHCASRGKLAGAFRSLFGALGLKREPQDDIGLPKVTRTSLSPYLVQVLLLWTIEVNTADPPSNAQSGAVGDYRPELIRFVMFWWLCVENESKASIRCFEAVRKILEKDPKHLNIFAELHKLLIESSFDRVAIPLARPGEMRKYLVCEESHIWRSDNERFKNDPGSPWELARRWWTRAEVLLPWFQRAYLERSFPDFDPASGRDGETPYDVDHIIPQSDWAGDWRKFNDELKKTGFFSDEELRQMRWARFTIGHAVGNKWLIDYSTNRSWGDAPFANKLDSIKCIADDMAFNPDKSEIWQAASGKDGPEWSKKRLTAFQRAVEERTAWLYEQFYKKLGFEKWEGQSAEIPHVSPASEVSSAEQG